MLSEAQFSNQYRIGDLHPPIQNCEGGIGGDHLHGALTGKEVDAVKLLPINSNIADQEVLEKMQCCETKGGKVPVVYFPVFEGKDFQTQNICAFCVGECDAKV